VLGNA
jgi:hypothetical protein